MCMCENTTYPIWVSMEYLKQGKQTNNITLLLTYNT